MPKVIPIPEGAAERLRLELKKVRTKAQYPRVLCVWLRVELGMRGDEIARILRWNPSAVRRLHAQYLREGEAAIRLPGRGGRRHAYLSARGARVSRQADRTDKSH